MTPTLFVISPQADHLMKDASAYAYDTIYDKKLELTTLKITSCSLRGWIFLYNKEETNEQIEPSTY